MMYFFFLSILRTLARVSKQGRGSSELFYFASLTIRYKAATTLAEFYALGGSKADARNDLERGYIKLTRGASLSVE